MAYPFSEALVREILMRSDGTWDAGWKPGRSPAEEKLGHVSEKHVWITKEGLADREITGNIFHFNTAFLDFTQTVQIATIVLNHPEAQAKIKKLYETKRDATKRFQREAIDVDLHQSFRVRAGGGNKTLLCSTFLMIAEKRIGFPYHFGIVTFFPSMKF